MSARPKPPASTAHRAAARSQPAQPQLLKKIGSGHGAQGHRLCRCGADHQRAIRVTRQLLRRQQGCSSRAPRRHHGAVQEAQALAGADALVICTEWQQFRAPDFDEMELRMPGKLIVDGRNLYQPAKMQANGWNYLSVGRAPVLAESTLAA